MAKKDDRRVSREDVRNSARSSGGGSKFFKLPKGVKMFAVEKPGTYPMDFLPYLIKTDNHPDKIKPGKKWYRLPFFVFKNIGVNNETVVSPASIGLPCPIMEERKRLSADWDNNEKAIKALGMQKFMAYVIKDPDDEDAVCVYADSIGKFANKMDEELGEESTEDNLMFFETSKEDGRTVKARYSNIDFVGQDGKPAKYLGLTRVDFETRPAMDEDEILAKTPCLEECLNVLPYDRLKALFLQADASATSGNPSATTSGSSKDKSGTTRKDASKAKDDEKEPEDKEETPTFKKGDKVKGKDDAGKPVKGTVSKIDDQDITVVDKDGEEHDCDVDDLELVESKSDKKPEPEDKEENDEKEEPEEGNTEATDPDSDEVVEVGDKVKDEDGVEGIVLKIDKSTDDVTIKTKDGAVIIDLDDLKVVKKGAAKGGKAKDEDKEESKDDETPSFEPDAKVMFDDDDQEGVVIRMKDDKVKIRLKDGTSVLWDATDVKLKKK